MQITIYVLLRISQLITAWANEAQNTEGEIISAKSVTQ